MATEVLDSRSFGVGRPVPRHSSRLIIPGQRRRSAGRLASSTTLGAATTRCVDVAAQATTGTQAWPLSSVEDETANSLTHGVGLVLALIAAYVFLSQAAEQGSAMHLGTCAVYGVSLVVLYAASTCYHLARDARWKGRLQLADHVCIYLLIAGTYTPISLSLLGDAAGWTLLLLVWGSSAVGILYKVANAHRLDETSALPYVVVGCMAFVVMKPLMDAVPQDGLRWLLAGGFFYVTGVLFFLRDHLRYFHAVWHLFVLAGSGCHYWALLQYVAPLNA